MTIELGKYKGLEYNRPEVEVLDEEDTLFIDSLLEQHKEEKDKTSGIEKDDMVLLDFDISHDGEKVPELSRKGYNLKIGNKKFYEDFEARLYGKKAGENINFNMVLPEDDTHNPNADKSIEVDLKIQSVKESYLPELSDDLVKSFKIKAVNNIKGLKEIASKKIYYNKLLQESSSIIVQIMKNILDNSKVDLNKEEIETVREDIYKRLNEQLETQNVKLDVYLMIEGITVEEYQARCREEAVNFLTEKAVIEEIGRREDISLSNKEVSYDQLYYQEVVKFLLKENTTTK